MLEEFTVLTCEKCGVLLSSWKNTGTASAATTYKTWRWRRSLRISDGNVSPLKLWEWHFALDLYQIKKNSREWLHKGWGYTGHIYVLDIGHRARCMEDIIPAVSKNFEEGFLHFSLHGSVKTSLPVRNSGAGFDLSIHTYSYTINRGCRGVAIAKYVICTLPHLPSDF